MSSICIIFLVYFARNEDRVSVIESTTLTFLLLYISPCFFFFFSLEKIRCESNFDRELNGHRGEKLQIFLFLYQFIYFFFFIVISFSNTSCKCYKVGTHAVYAQFVRSRCRGIYIYIHIYLSLIQAS